MTAVRVFHTGLLWFTLHGLFAAAEFMRGENPSASIVVMLMAGAAVRESLRDQLRSTPAEASR